MDTHFHKKPNMYTSHIQLKVSNLARSVEFYQRVIGFKVLEQIENIAYLTVDGKYSLVSLIQVENATPLRNGQTGLYHMALLLPSRRDFGNLIKHFADLDISIGAGDHHVSEALYLDDPDGNGIEMYIDRPEEEWLWQGEQVYMTTEAVDFMSSVAVADGKWTGLPEGTVMGHVHLSVADIATTRKFYTEVLDYQVTTVYGRQAFFVSTGNYHHHIGFNVWNSANGSRPSVSSVGLQSFTIVLKDEAYAEHVRDNLKVAGYITEKYEEGPMHGGSQSFSTVDPNGIRILFTTEGM